MMYRKGPSIKYSGRIQIVNPSCVGVVALLQNTANFTRVTWGNLLFSDLNIATIYCLKIIQLLNSACSLFLRTLRRIWSPKCPKM